MIVTFDTTKDATNLEKHGVSLAEAASLDWVDALVWPDQRRDYGEARMVGLAPMGSRLFFVVFVDRSNERRIISLRKANEREVKRYAEND